MNRTYYFAEDAEQSVIVLEMLDRHICNREVTDDEWELCEPRIRLSYGDFTVSLPNLAQTWGAFDSALRTMISEMKEAGV